MLFHPRGHRSGAGDPTLAPVTQPQSSTSPGYSAGVVAVGAGLVVASLGTYLFHAIGGRTMPTAEFGLFGSIWSAFFLVVIVAFLAFEQTITARLARSDSSVGGPRSFALIGVVTLVGIVALEIIARQVLGVNEGMVLAWLALGVFGYGALYPLRGIKAGTRRFWAYGGLFASESLVRLLVLWLLSLVHPLTLVDFVAAMALAPVIVVTINLTAYRVLGWSEDHLSIGVGSIGALGLANLALVAMLNLGPVLVTARGSAAASALLFAALLIVRSPLYLFQSVTSTALVFFGRAIETQGVAVVWRRIARWAIGVTLLGFGLALLVSPLVRWIVGVIFGADLQLEPADYALIGAAVVGVIVSLVLNQYYIAARLEMVVAVSWVVGLVVFLGVASAGSNPLRSTEWALLAGQTIVIALLLLLGHSRVSREVAA